MSISTIRSFFEQRLATWAAARSPVVPIAYQNAAFTKPAVPFVECFLIPNRTAQKEVAGNRATMLGLFQVNCWAPKGYGMGALEAMATSIVDTFPMLPKGVVSVEATPTIERAMLDDSGWVVVPIVIQYRLEKFS